MKCPKCGAGLSSKYRKTNVQHPRYNKHRIRRMWRPSTWSNCSWTPSEDNE